MGMPAEASDPRAEIEHAENVIQLVMAAVVPGVLAAMLFSYVLFSELTLLLLAAPWRNGGKPRCPLNPVWESYIARGLREANTRGASVLLIELNTSIVGMIYIAAISVFAVSLLSFTVDFNPEHPATFAVEGGLLMSLIGIMTYQSQNKERFLSGEKRFFSNDPKQLEERLVAHLMTIGHSHKRSGDGSAYHLDLPESGLRVHIHPLTKSSTEVLLENINEKNLEIAMKLKGCLEPPF